MTVRTQWWLVVPLAAALGCAGAQQAQKETKAGGNAALIDEGPATATATTQAAPRAQLVPFQGNGGYSVLMPANPETNDRTEDTPGGQVQVHIAQARDPAAKYLSTVSDFPKGSLDRIKSKDLLDSLQQATIQSMGGTLVNAHDIDVAGLPGREFTATDPEGSEVTARVFVGPSRVYTLAGTYPQGQMPGTIEQFLGSFQPPAGSAVGGSGSAGGATTGDTMGGTSTSQESSVTTTPAAPSTTSRKKSRRSSSTSGSSSTDTGSGSR